MSVSDCACACVHVFMCVRVDMLMTLFVPHAHFSSFVTCLRCGGDMCVH